MKNLTLISMLILLSISLVYAECSSQIFVSGKESCEANLGAWSQNTCTLSKDIEFCYNGITLIESNMIFDCNNHKVSGKNTGMGLYIQFKKGIVIKNCLIEGFDEGIIITGTATSNITNNIFRNNRKGLVLEKLSTSNNIMKNTFSGNTEYGIWFFSSSKNKVFENVFQQNSQAITLGGISTYNIVSQNNIQQNDNGIEISTDSHNNWVYYNNLVENKASNAIDYSGQNDWDDSSCAGNYYSDYTNTPRYKIQGKGSSDNFPLKTPWLESKYSMKQGKIDCSKPKDNVETPGLTGMAVSDTPSTSKGFFSRIIDWLKSLFA